MPKDGCKEDADSSDKSSQQGKNAVRKEDADRHRTRVASHTAVPMGTAKWLGRTIPTPETLPLGKGHTEPLSPTQGQADIIGGNLIPAISQPPRGAAVWLATIV